MKSIKQAQITLLILLYLLFASACLLSGLPNINNYQWNIDYSIWGSNEIFIDTIAIWSNLFLLSISPTLLAIILGAKRKLIALSCALPLFWGFVLVFAIYEDSEELGLFLSDFAKVVYGILFVSIIGTAIQLYFVLKRIREERKLEKLEQFQERALHKLNRLNPEHNQQLLEDVMGDHGHALNLLIASHYYEDDEEKQKELTRLALHYAMKEKDALRQLEKRMLRYAKIKLE